MRKLKSLFQMVFSFGNATSVASKQRGRKAENRGAEDREAENRERAVLLELFVYFLCHIVCLGEGVVDCASTRDLDALPQAPTLRSLSKSGFALSPGRRFLPLPH